MVNVLLRNFLFDLMHHVTEKNEVFITFVPRWKFYFSDTGRGLMTKTSISQGEILLSLPKTLLITTETVLASQAGEHLKK